MKVAANIVIMVLFLSALGARVCLSAQTWYLEQNDWKLLSDEAKDTYSKADQDYQKGKLARAALHYNKFLEYCDSNSRLYDHVLNRQFSIAEKLLAGRKIAALGIFRISGYASGIRIMERISERATIEDPNGIGFKAATALAGSYEQKGQSDPEYYELAYLKWFEIFEAYEKQFSTVTGYSRSLIEKILKDALLAMARCKHLQYRADVYCAADLTGKTFSETAPYDSARGCYEQFATRYPQDAAKLAIAEKLEQIDEQLASKDLSTGQYYERTGNAQAANLYYDMVVRKWPNTEAAKLARQAFAATPTTEEPK
jgi:hypothetical protein